MDRLICLIVGHTWMPLPGMSSTAKGVRCPHCNLSVPDIDFRAAHWRRLRKYLGSVAASESMRGHSYPLPPKRMMRVASRRRYV